ncbi:MAG: fibronectin type III domain-containing protein, partial [Bacteroidetes bacterium]|nr:fibronectin type III domain-containing protein [Bacteroidota bacterium]
ATEFLQDFSGPVTLNIGASVIVNVNFAPASEGSKVAELQIRNSANTTIYKVALSGEAISNDGTNTAPVVDAGTDQTITLPENSLTLIGKASDEDGSLAYTSWTKVNGPAVSMSGMTTLNLKLANLTEGTYTFKLSVKDNLGAITTDNVVVTVKPAPAQTSSSPGLNYKYYTTNNQQAWSKLPNFSSMTPAKTGIVSNFSLAPKTQSDYFGFSFTGYIEITTAGTYTFYTKSDDGSKLFINNQMIVNNDGTHGVRERNGKVYLEAGYHAIEANYFDKVNGEKLEVSYTGPGLGKQIIPASVLYTEIPQQTEDTQTTERETENSTEILAPSNLTARLNTNGSVYLSWTDASNNEAGFEIFLSLDNTEDYQPAGSTTADKIQYTVGNLPAGHDYHFKVRAKNGQLYSLFSNVASVITKTAENTKESGTTQNGNRKIMVNFNYGNNVAAPWNNFDTDPDPQDQLSDMVDSQGNSTTVDITLLTTWGWEGYGGNGHNNYGMSTGNDSGVYPDQVMQSSFWTQRADAEEMLVSGLEPNEYYSFTFFGSRDASGERTTHYSIGRTTVSLDASYNTAKTVTITNAKADASGNLKVYVQKDASAPYGYLNAMVIEATGYTEGFTATAGHRNTATEDVEEAKKEKTNFMQDGFQILSTYPNPAVDHLIVKYDNTLSGSKMQLQIVDLAGNVRIEQEQTATDVNGTIRIDFDRTKIASGYYILRIATETGTKNIKFLKM